MNWEPIKPSQDDIEWMQLREQERARMINAFKLSPELLGFDKIMSQVQNSQGISDTEFKQLKSGILSMAEGQESA